MFSWFQKYQFIINFTKLRGYWVKEHLITMKKETSKTHTKLYCIINKVVRNIIHVRVCKKKTKKKQHLFDMHHMKSIVIWRSQCQ